MKENISSFSLEAAFKALDDIELPEAKEGIKANKVNLNETFSLSKAGKNKTDLLIEDYYDLNNQQDLEQAKEDRENDIAKAKLARIEKIVDLDAKTADELLPSYVGKRIIQCPQCMILFYKSAEDIEENEENPEVVNVGEVCQHCGNDTGYTLIGKVDEVKVEDEEPTTVETDKNVEASAEEKTEEATVESEEEEVPAEVETEEDIADSTTDETVIDNVEAAKEAAGEFNFENDAAETDEEVETEETEEETKEDKEVKESFESQTLVEESESDIKAMLNGREFKTPVTDNEVRSYFAKANEDLETPIAIDEDEAIEDKELTIDDAEDFVEESFNNCITNYLQEVYQNVETFETTGCSFNDADKFICEGLIKFKSGRVKNTAFVFNKTENSNILEGLNEDITSEKAFSLAVSVNENKQLITEKFDYNYKINNTEIKGSAIN